MINHDLTHAHTDTLFSTAVRPAYPTRLGDLW
ncbi:hypothetical protein VCA_002280 [Vibrio albensis VL426]|nr:hypothetical protein VCA_002280 [Vibrio cholerae VL426]